MHALKYFLKKTAELGSIAFFQWRYRFPSGYTVEEELVEILEQRLELLFDPLKEVVDTKAHFKANTK